MVSLQIWPPECNFDPNMSHVWRFWTSIERCVLKLVLPRDDPVTHPWCWEQSADSEGWLQFWGLQPLWATSQFFCPIQLILDCRPWGGNPFSLFPLSAETSFPAPSHNSALRLASKLISWHCADGNLNLFKARSWQTFYSFFRKLSGFLSYDA